MILILFSFTDAHTSEQRQPRKTGMLYTFVVVVAVTCPCRKLLKSVTKQSEVRKVTRILFLASVHLFIVRLYQVC